MRNTTEMSYMVKAIVGTYRLNLFTFVHAIRFRSSRFIYIPLLCGYELSHVLRQVSGLSCLSVLVWLR